MYIYINIKIHSFVHTVRRTTLMATGKLHALRGWVRSEKTEAYVRSKRGIDSKGNFYGHGARLHVVGV